MGTGQSKEKFHCNRYLDGKGPPPLIDQVNGSVNGLFQGSKGTQPDGQMTWVILHRDLPGFPTDNTVQVNYVFPDGTQEEGHPNPGQPFTGLRTLAYLPDNKDGRKVLRLLDKAFTQRLLFTVATDANGDSVVCMTDIPLKTLPDGGSQSESFPDPDYLRNVKFILKEKGIE